MIISLVPTSLASMPEPPIELTIRAQSVSNRSFLLPTGWPRFTDPKETAFISVELERSILAYRPGRMIKRLAEYQRRKEVSRRS